MKIAKWLIVIFAVLGITFLIIPSVVTYELPVKETVENRLLVEELRLSYGDIWSRSFFVDKDIYHTLDISFSGTDYCRVMRIKIYNPDNVLIHSDLEGYTEIAYDSLLQPKSWTILSFSPIKTGTYKLVTTFTEVGLWDEVEGIIKISGYVWGRQTFPIYPHRLGLTLGLTCLFTSGILFLTLLMRRRYKSSPKTNF